MALITGKKIHTYVYFIYMYIYIIIFVKLSKDYNRLNDGVLKDKL